MTTKFALSLASLVTLLLLAPLGHAQDWPFHDPSQNDVCVRGEIAESQQPNMGLMIQLRGVGSGGALPLSATVTPSGEFELDCVPTGEYQLQVVNGRGEVVHDEIVSLRPGNASLKVALGEQDRARPASGPVSLGQLGRKVKPKAVSELRKSNAAQQKGELAQAIEHAEKALRKDPGFVEAHIQLGVIYAHQNRKREAADEFSRAAELDEDFALAHSNLAVVLLKMERYAEAEQSARRALDLDHSLRQMEYVLGYSLAIQGRNPGEALEYLERAARQYPRAHLVAARVLVDVGRIDEAAGEIRQYLSSASDTSNRQEVESWLTRLDQQLASAGSSE